MNSSIFEGFKEREEKLRDIYRYSMFEVFFYRSNVWDHTQRVALIVKDISPLVTQVLPDFNGNKAYTLALVHDDAEIITGDVQLGHKLKMSAKELQQVDMDEAAAVETLARQFPKEVAGFSYKELLLNALHKDNLEAKVVSLADKIDAYCESMHEVLGGNITALRSLLTYEKILAGFDKKYPELDTLLANEASPLTNFEQRLNSDYVLKDAYQHSNKPHTESSIKLDTDFPTYNRWRKLVVEYLPNGVQLLTHQKEFL